MKKRNLLLTLASVATVILMMVLMAGCGETSEEPEPTTEPAATAHSVSGIVDDLSQGNLEIYTQADEELSFNIENAEIDSPDGINPGDTATVEYTGEISGGDTSACTVTKVIDVAGATTTIEGVVESVNDNNTVTISSNNKKYTFKSSDAAKNGNIKKGENVKLTFAGVINGDDASHAYVKSMEAAKPSTEPTETTANAVTIKAVNETVWASTKVNVRAEASTSSEKVGTIKKGTKLTRTGVLSNGWSRVTYKDKDRYISSSYLTTKDPAKKSTKATETKTKATETKATETKATETKATETKATETKATETKATETKTEEPTETKAEEPTETKTEEPTETQTEPPTEAPTEPPTEAPTEPPTVTAKGVVTDISGRTLTLDSGKTFNIAGAKLDVSGDEALGQTVVVEYQEGSDSAIHVYLEGGSKAIGEDSSSGVGTAGTIAIILAIIAIAIAVLIVIIRNRRKTA